MLITDPASAIETIVRWRIVHKRHPFPQSADVVERQLASTARALRTALHRGVLDQETADLVIEQIGAKSSIRLAPDGQSLWESRLNDLTNYVTETGTLPRGQTIRDSRHAKLLYQWLLVQKRALKDGKLSTKRAAALQERACCESVTD